ncbi:hypothetical protein A2318_02910 [Candidatus Uhrbacteria bacterium RIFOXYB2_FULL_45_11]|uniref:Uncharacterized protein n=1 Tax=Candidatus Uhrbacteria bacterium RIFOXYB2_FULL_45_11 TaxID=1802421 RepID=A0A1F7W1G1_9BACT|nr:MAG: hypothetical protein A2318_02910 [Candidatus Uhrbacteria bacterium RIFOXYB2_FULL_45_11]
MDRYIGIQHRTKKTKDGDARPTIVAILQNSGKSIKYELETEDDELAFAHGRFVTKWRTAEVDERVSELPAWQVRVVGKADKQKTQIAVSWDGLSKGDIVTSILGGSGDNFAFALSRKAEDVGAIVQRCTGKTLHDTRGARDKSEDALTLAEIGRDSPELTYKCEVRDRRYITVRELWFRLRDAMKYRTACEVQLKQKLIGERFRQPDGLYPEGSIKDAYLARKASDLIFRGLLLQEKQIEKELVIALEQVTVWPLFKREEYKGCGPRTVARLIASIVDIRRFIVKPDEAEMQTLKQECAEIERKYANDLARISLADCPFRDAGGQKYWKLQKLASQTGSEDAKRAVQLHKKRHQLRQKAQERSESKLVAFCGVHVMQDGKFPRRRTGQTSNWSPAARQALYLLAEQWVKRPDSFWGRKLKENKARLRIAHPEMIEVEGKKRYTDGHIHNMACWRTATQFVRKLANDWMKLEGSPAISSERFQKAA